MRWEVHTSAAHSFFIHHFYLLRDALFVDQFKEFAYKARIHTAQTALCTALVQNFRVAIRLHDGHIVVTLVGSDFSADAHAARQEVEQRVVALVDLFAQRFEVLRQIGHFANHEFVANQAQHVGSHLL